METKSDKPIAVSFYTESYAKMAARLEAGLRRVGIETDIVPIHTRGSWQRNCAYKPRFLLDKFLQHGRPIIWLDADATIQNNPTLFIDDYRRLNDYDIAVRTSNTVPPHPWNAAMTGTVYLPNHKRTEELLRRWNRLCVLNPQRWDQYSLAMILQTEHKAGDSWKVFDLPEPYCAVADRRTTTELPIIVHWQASRVNKDIEGDEGDKA